MSTAATTGAGTTFAHCATSNGSFTSIGELLDVKFPEGMVAKAEATHYTSASATKEFIPIPWKEWNDIDFEINYVAAEAVILNGILGTALFWKITLTDGKVYAFPGFLSDIGGEIPNQNKSTQKGKVTVTGVCSLT